MEILSYLQPFISITFIFCSYVGGCLFCLYFYFLFGLRHLHEHMKSVASLIFQHKFDSLRPSVIRSHLKILGLVFCFWDLVLLEVAVLPRQKGTDLTWEVEMNG